MSKEERREGTASGGIDGLERRLDDFEERFVGGDDSALRRGWLALKGDIREVIRSSKAPPVVGKARLPAILIATPEIVSLPSNMGNLAEVITTGDGGGLADISAALVAELDRLGVNVNVTLPEYENIFTSMNHLRREEYDRLKSDMYDGRNRIYPITDGLFESAKRVYGDDHAGLDKMDLRMATAFQRGVIYRALPLVRRRNREVLVHCNDWMTGLIPAAARSEGVRSLMTFHNIFTHHQWPKGLQKHGIDVSPFWQHLYFRHHPGRFGGFEGNYHNNDVDFLTSGIFAADMINTVSPTFLKELVEGYFQDHGLIPDDMRAQVRVRWEQGSAVGILNAPSAAADPRTDPLIPHHYWHTRTDDDAVLPYAEGKARNKAEFQRLAGLEISADTPLFFWPSRIARPQKGFELLLAILPSLMAYHGKLQVAVVANGDLELIGQMERFARDFPGRVSYRAFDRALSQLGKAGSDFLLMPSLYEPCGIPQVEGPRYGTLPVVRRTGGLADTVEHLSGNGIAGNGFVFNDYLPDALWFGIDEAMRFYGKDARFRHRVRRRVIRESFERFNITVTARKYIECYQAIFERYDPSIRVI
jgi:ADP-glucose type glycogen/starch synthase